MIRTIYIVNWQHKRWAIAATLQTLKVKTANCGVFAYRSAAAYQGIWGALLAGSCYVPMNPRFPTDKNHSVLLAADCAVIIVDQRSEDAARKLLLKLDKGIVVLLPEHNQLPTGVRQRRTTIFVRGRW